MIRELREQNEKLKSQLAGGKVDMAEIGKATFLVHSFITRWQSPECQLNMRFFTLSAAKVVIKYILECFGNILT